MVGGGGGGAGGVEEEARRGRGTILTFVRYTGGLSCPRKFLVLLFKIVNLRMFKPM